MDDVFRLWMDVGGTIATKKSNVRKRWAGVGMGFMLVVALVAAYREDWSVLQSVILTWSAIWVWPVAAKRLRRLVGRRALNVAVVALVVALVGISTGRWKDVVGTVIAASAASGLWSLEIARLRRVFDRRAHALEQRARGLGLTPTASDARVHEGDGERGHVRVWAEDPPMLHDSVSVLTLWCLALIVFGMTKLGVLFLVGGVTGAVLLSMWTSRRVKINVEWVNETGSLHQVEVHRSADVDVELDRPGLAAEGALGLSDHDDPVGRIGIARESGALSSSGGEE
jgi:hypothetical protein